MDIRVPRSDGFYEAAPDGPGYAVDQDVSLMDAGNNRTQAVASMQRGAIHTFLGILPSSLAVLDALVQLVFALCLIALWVGLPIGLVFVFFSQTASGVTGLELIVWFCFLTADSGISPAVGVQYTDACFVHKVST